MKTKRKRTERIFAILALMAAMLFAITAPVISRADSVTVRINGTELIDGKYYTTEASPDFIMIQHDDVPSGSDYFYYNNGEMTVYGYVYIDYAGSADSVIDVQGGTLTIKGDGDLNVFDKSGERNVINGDAASTIKTADDYAGNISLTGYKALINGFKAVKLNTSKKITLDYNGRGGTVVSAGSVTLNANEVKLYDQRTTVENFIEATDIENGQISITTTGDVDFDANINSSGCLFKAKNIILSPNADMYLVAGIIAEGNLDIKSNSDGRIILSAIDQGGVIVTGDLNVEAPGMKAEIQADASAIKGNAKINANSLLLEAGEKLIEGDAAITCTDYISLATFGGNSVIGGNTTVNSEKGIIEIGRYATTSDDMLGGELNCDSGIVQFDDNGKYYIKVFPEGITYYADNCAHPIVDAYAHCMVCGAADIRYADVYGADGVLKLYFDSTFDSNNYPNDIDGLSNGDTVVLLKDIYARGGVRTDFGNKDIKIDLDGHKLTSGTFSTQNKLTITNGKLELDEITNSSVGNPGTLTFDKVDGKMSNLSWMTVDGAVLIESDIVIKAMSYTDHFWTEKLAMDDDSTLTLNNVRSGLKNYGRYTLEDSLGAIEKFLPEGYSIKRGSFNGSTDIINTIVDSNGDLAANVTLAYRLISDARAAITLNPSVYTYDGAAKTPEITVTYKGKTLTKDTDYTVAYADNINAGTATVTITGKGIYHDSKSMTFTINKAAQNAPSGLKAVNASEKGKNDGCISNVSTDMEYSSDKINWTKVTQGTTVRGLAAGEYYVRYAENSNYLASPETKVSVGINASTVISGDDKQTEAATKNDTTEASEAAADKNVNTGDAFPLAGMIVLMLAMAGAAMTAYRKIHKNADEK